MERSSTDKRKKEMIVMPGLKHDIFHEKQPDGITYMLTTNTDLSIICREWMHQNRGELLRPKLRE